MYILLDLFRQSLSKCCVLDASRCYRLIRTYHISQDAYRLQLKLFLSEVRQQQLLSSIRSFLKLYTTISIGKLASFMDIDEPTVR